MKHEEIRPQHRNVPVPNFSDEESEVRVFSELKAKQNDGVISYQYPDNRTVWQRLVAWGQLRYHCFRPVGDDDAAPRVKDPAWRGHWATTKYI